MSLARLCDLLGDGPDSSFEPIKHGTPADDELQGLGDEIGGQWLMLGRRLGVRDKELQEINQAHVLLGEKGYYMLKHWKRKEGSAATYKAVCDALKHERVRRPDLVEKFCHIKGISSLRVRLRNFRIGERVQGSHPSLFEPSKPIKYGTPTDDELEGLGDEIEEKLGRLLGVRDQYLQEINRAHDQLCDKGCYMLKHWERKEGSAAAYKVVCDALKHELIRRPDLAEKFCHIKGISSPEKSLLEEASKESSDSDEEYEEEQSSDSDKDYEENQPSDSGEDAGEDQEHPCFETEDKLDHLANIMLGNIKYP